jgi:hypothetical protein
VIVNIYQTGGRIARSVCSGRLIAELDFEPHEIPFDLERLARQHGGDYAEIVYPPHILFEEPQPA